MKKKSLQDPVIVPLNSRIRLYPSAKLFDPVNTTQQDMDELTIEIIAGALSKLCRFGGHCKEFYSVAQHAYNVSKICAPYELEGLCHDNTEGLGLVDIPRPVKYAPGLEPYRIYEMNLAEKLDIKFGLYPASESVKRADDQMLVAEMKALCPIESYNHYVKVLKEKGFTEFIFPIEPWSPKKAEQMYLERYYQLVKLRNQPEINEEDGSHGVI